MNYLAALNRVSELIKTNKLDSKLRNEDYCEANFGIHATQVTSFRYSKKLSASS